MESLGLVHQKHGNLGWEVLPKNFEDMPEQALDFLRNSSIDESEIRNAFGKYTETPDTDTTWILGVNMTRLVPSLRDPHIFLPAY